jgi:mono/diheme cytochrome c family protein
VAVAVTASWGAAQDTPRSSSGKDVFRFDTFGNETFWTDTLRLHEAIASVVDPTTALSVGLKVDADALPPGILEKVDLKSPATTVALLKMNAVVGVKGTVVSKDGKDALTRVGITCALCHSTVDDSVMPGIGRRLDGRPNLTLNPGAIIALSPALDASKKAVYNSWGPGRYDPRFNQDGKNGPVVIPPAFGLAKVRNTTYTGDGDISYWNSYVAVTQMGGHGTFKEPRLGISVVAKGRDLVRPKLSALRAYQHSLAKPTPPAGSFDAAAATRGQALFAGAGRCATCHSGAAFTDEKLHAPAETGMDPAYAARSASKKYRSTPLRALWSHAPYFHDGKAKDLPAVVDHYDSALGLKLSAEQKKDLVEYLKSI